MTTDPGQPGRRELSPARVARLVWTVALNLLVLAVVLLVLVRTWRVVSWILIAALVAIALDVPVRWLHARGAPRAAAIGAVMVAAIGVLVVAGALLVPIVTEQMRNLAYGAPEVLAWFQRQPWLEWADERFQLLERARTELAERGARAAGPIFGAARGVLTAAVALVIILVLTAFMLVYGAEVFARAVAWFPPEERDRVRAIALGIRRKVGGYVLGTLVVAGIAGVATAIGMAILGNPYFLALGALLLVMGLVPYVGATIGGIVVVATTLASVGTTAALIALVGFLVYQQIEGNLLQPLVQRHTLQMNPLLITVAVLIGTALAGILGTFLALPAAGVVQVLARDLLERRQARWARGTGALAGARAEAEAGRAASAGTTRAPGEEERIPRRP